MPTRYFDLSDILTVTTGRLVSNRHMDGIYDIMGFLLNDKGLTTLGIMDMAEVCQDELLKQHPQLAEVNKHLPNWNGPSDLVRMKIDMWLEGMYATYGGMLPVRPIDHEVMRKTDLQIFLEVRNNK